MLFRRRVDGARDVSENDSSWYFEDRQPSYDFCAEAPEHLPNTVSGVYYKLHAYIEKSCYLDLPVTRQAIFGLAYAQYSKDKKLAISNHRKSGSSPNGDAIKKCHVQFSDEYSFQRYREIAQGIIAASFMENEGKFLKSIEDRITKHIDHKEKWTIRKYFCEAVMHVLVIGGVVIIFTFGLAILPYTRGFVSTFLHYLHAPEILDLVRQAIS